MVDTTVGGGGGGAGCCRLARRLLVRPLPAAPQVVSGYGGGGEGRQFPHDAAVLREHSRGGVDGACDLVNLEAHEVKDRDVRAAACCTVLGNEGQGNGVEEVSLLLSKHGHTLLAVKLKGMISWLILPSGRRGAYDDRGRHCCHFGCWCCVNHGPSIR